MYSIFSLALQNVSKFCSAVNFSFGSKIFAYYPAVCAILFVFVGVLISFLRTRAFTVECWFCGGCMKVIWMERKCFTCVHCDQYNGFSSDGGYNRPFNVFNKANGSVRYASINRKVFPILTEWLSSKRWKSDKPAKLRKPCQSLDSNFQSNLGYTCLLPKWMHLLARSSSLSCFLFLIVGTVIDILIMRFCTVSTKIEKQWAAKLIELISPMSLEATSQSCPYLIRLNLYFTLPNYGWLWFAILLFILQGIITGIDSVMYKCKLDPDDLFDRMVANPFVLLCDLSLFVLSGNVLLNTIMNTVNGSSNTSLLSSVRHTQSAFMLLASVVLVLASYNGLRTWLSFCSYDFRRQKQKLRENWPDTFIQTELSPTSQSSNSLRNLSPFKKTQSDPLTLRDIPREFSSLSISSPRLPQKRSPASTKVIDSRPHLFTANSTIRPKSVFDWKTPDYTLFSCPTVVYKPTPFASSDMLYDRHLSHSESDDCDVGSVVTSVSRTKRNLMSPRSCYTSISDVSAWRTKSRRRKKTQKRRKSLLRFCLTFLFGQLDSWQDVVSELTYFLNALLLGCVIYGICRLLLCILKL